jgi:predicted Mrr-cat superfamily restriction endonuclease
MSWTLITKATRPDTDTDFFTGKNQVEMLTDSDFAYIKETYKDTGKLVSITQALSDNELELLKTFVFKDEASALEWHDDDKMVAWVSASDTYNTNNDIEYVIVSKGAT